MSNGPSGQASNVAGLPDQRIVALVLVSLLADFLVTVVEYPVRGPSGPLIVLKVALASSQLGLLGVWLGLSEPWPSPRKVLVFGLAILAWFVAFAGLSSFEAGMAYGFIMLSTLPATVALGLFIARTADVRLYNIRSDHSSVVGAAAYQFSLRQMFLWTAIVAAIITVVMLLLPVMGWLIGIVVRALFMAMFTWAAIWAVLGRCVGWRLAVLCAAPGGLVFLLTLLIGPPGTVPWSWAVLLMLHCLLTAGSLAVFRANGYRVSRQMKNAE